MFFIKLTYIVKIYSLSSSLIDLNKLIISRGYANIMRLTRLFNTTVKTKNVLITGANRGLGLELSDQLTKAGWRVSATARPEKMDELEHNFKKIGADAKQIFAWDLCETPDQNKIKSLLSMADAEWSAVVHCASPYWTKLLAETTPSELERFHNVMANDTLLLTSATELMKKQVNPSVLAITGAVIGRPNINFRGIIGLVKAHQRQLSAALEYETNNSDAAKKLSVRHFDLGSFRQTPLAEENPRQFIPEPFVAKVIADCLEQPKKYNHDTHLVSPNDEDNYGVTASLMPVNYNKLSL